MILYLILIVCLFINDKRQNGLNNKVQFLLWDLTWPQERSMDAKNNKELSPKNIDIRKKN